MWGKFRMDDPHDGQKRVSGLDFGFGWPSWASKFWFKTPYFQLYLIIITFRCGNVLQLNFLFQVRPVSNIFVRNIILVGKQQVSWKFSSSIKPIDFNPVAKHLNHFFLTKTHSHNDANNKTNTRFSRLPETCNCYSYLHILSTAHVGCVHSLGLCVQNVDTEYWRFCNSVWCRCEAARFLPERWLQ